MFPRRVLSLVVITLTFSTAIGSQAPSPATASTSAQSASADKEAVALQSSDLSGLRLRGIGPATMSGRFVDMDVVESNPYTMYVASATGGMYRTTDNGITWAPVFEREAVHSIGDVAIYQPDPNIIWVGSGERANRQSVSWGDGVYKTTDAGKTWINVGLKTSMHIGRIVTHPSNPAIVYVAAQGSVWGPGGERGLYRTMDGGKSWQRTLHVDEETGVTDVAMDTLDPTVLYAASYQRRRTAFGFNGGGPGSALWKSTDAGATWTKLTGNGLPEGEYGRIGIAVYRKDPRVVIASIEQGFRYNASTAYTQRRGGLYRSNDAGKTWRFMSDWNPRPMYASQPVIDPQDDRRVYMMNSYSFSDNGGESFTSPNTTTHGDDRFVWINPRDSRHVIKLDDGGIGLFFSPNGGANWIELKNNMPTLPFNDLVIHPRDNDLVLASHGRGIWILDKINALQELTPQVIGSAAHLFTVAPAYQIRQTNLKAHTGDMWFRGDNPANGALVDYWIGTPGVAPVITVHTSSGQLVNTLRGTGNRGVNRIVWNLRETDLPIRGGGGGDDDDAAPRGGVPGPLVAPGTYLVRLVAGGRTMEQKVEVREDPRIEISPAERKQWTDAVHQAAALAREFGPVNDRIQKMPGTGADVVDLKRQSRELISRIGGLYGAVGRWTGAPTRDQLTRLAYYQQMVKQLSAQAP